MSHQRLKLRSNAATYSKLSWGERVLGQYTHEDKCGASRG